MTADERKLVERCEAEPIFGEVKALCIIVRHLDAELNDIHATDEKAQLPGNLPPSLRRPWETMQRTIKAAGESLDALRVENETLCGALRETKRLVAESRCPYVVIDRVFMADRLEEKA